MMNRSFACTLLLLAALPLFPAGQNEARPRPEIVIGAAASLAGALNEAIEVYRSINPALTITPSYAASGTLQRQIEQGAPIDLFISASNRQMDALADRGLLAPDSRRDLLHNRIVLIVPRSNDTVTGWPALATAKINRLALGEPKSVPVGFYAEQVLVHFGILEATRAKAVYAKDARQVLGYVESGEVDAGIVYATDVTGSNLVKIVSVAPEAAHDPVVYQAAVIGAGEHRKEAGLFLIWLASARARTIFAAHGFTFD